MNEITFDQNDVQTNKGLAILMAIIPILFFLPLVMDDKKNSVLLKFFANQTLLVLIGSAGSGVISVILGFIPVIGWLLSWAFGIFVFVLFIMNIINAANASGKSLPLVGSINIIK